MWRPSSKRCSRSANAVWHNQAKQEPSEGCSVRGWLGRSCARDSLAGRFRRREAACYTAGSRRFLELRRSQMSDDRGGRFPLGSRVRLEAMSRDPYPVLRVLQEQEPVSWVGELQTWFVTRHADCLAILLDGTTFSVASASSLLEDTLGQTMLSTDGARQRQLRQPFSRPFVPKGVQAHMAAPIVAYVHDLIDAFSARGRADLKT